MATRITLRAVSSLVLAGVLAACKQAEPTPPKAPAPTPVPQPSTTSNPTPTPTPTPTVVPAPVEQYDPYKLGFCEVTEDALPPTKTGGGPSNISTKYWAGPNTNNPQWPLMINCGSINLSVSSKDSSFPRSAGKYEIRAGRMNETQSYVSVMSPIIGAKGELVIDSFDMMGIKGSFRFKGMKGGKEASVVGVFHFQCPYTAVGQPCLEHPTAAPPGR